MQSNDISFSFHVKTLFIAYSKSELILIILFPNETHSILNLCIDYKNFLGYTLYILKGGIYMITQVKPWGNSQGIRLSKELLTVAGIQNNDFLDIEVVDGNIILKKTFKHRTLEERAEEFGGKLGPYDEFEWGEPSGREGW